MATFAELLADVYTLTNRSDLVAETKLAVKMATLKMHQSDYYYKDISETGITFLAADTIQQLDYRTLIPRWRALKYFRKSDSSGLAGDFLTLLTPEDVLDGYGYQRTDICYVAGENLQIKSSTLLQYAMIACYITPDITEATYNSWVALDHPYAIVFEAARAVSELIGLKEDAATYLRQVTEQINLLKSSNITAGGF